MAVGGKSRYSPCDGPCWVSERGGTGRGLSLLGQRDQRHSQGRRPPVPTPSSRCPLLRVPPVSLPFLPWFPSPLQVSAPVLPRETRLLANRVDFCWLGPCQGLGGHQGKGRTWGREVVTSGGRCSPERLPGPQDTASCALAKAGGLKPTQAPLSPGKGVSTLKPGFVFGR